MVFGTKINVMALLVCKDYKHIKRNGQNII